MQNGEGVSNPQDCYVDRKMDGCIGVTWWVSDSNKWNERIGKKMNGQRAFQMERVGGGVRYKL